MSQDTEQDWDEDLGEDSDVDDAPPPVQYPSVAAWVQDWLLPMWTRDVTADNGLLVFEGGVSAARRRAG